MKFFVILSEVKINITITDVLAVWGAFIATIVLVWDYIKWKNSGAQVAFKVQLDMNMVNVPGVESDKKVTCFRVDNKGDRPTTITNVGFDYYKNDFYRFFKKPSQSAVFIPLHCTGNIPYYLDVGKIWDGCMYKDSITECGIDGVYVFRLYVQHKDKPISKRIKYKKNKLS